jgi:crotonobetainyl-CoA:carnitine CoA-transferase CaiB-like acyl-CoA transferase
MRRAIAADDGAPMSGLRVLDFTASSRDRCARATSALGAEVMRVDPPHRPDMAG